METDIKTEFIEQGCLVGHNGWVTSIITGFPQKDAEDSEVVISCSRDKTVLIWKLYNENVEGFYGVPHKVLTGHNHFISDIVLSNDNNYLITGSWDKTLRLWDLKTGKTVKRFDGHNGEILAVAFSPDNRQIISAGTDRSIKLWNTKGECKFTSETSNHTDWVSNIKYSPAVKTATKNPINPYFASTGWDGKLKVWNTNFQIRYNFKAHNGLINALDISPNGMLLATGGRDQKVSIWEISGMDQAAKDFSTGAVVNQVAFNPKYQWITAATENGVLVWDIMSESTAPIAELEVIPEKTKDSKSERKPKALACTSLVWSPNGKKLFAGFTDGKIRVWHTSIEKK